jgi:hypothetical protein
MSYASGWIRRLSRVNAWRVLYNEALNLTPRFARRRLAPAR